MYVFVYMRPLYCMCLCMGALRMGTRACAEAWPPLRCGYVGGRMPAAKSAAKSAAAQSLPAPRARIPSLPLAILLALSRVLSCSLCFPPPPSLIVSCVARCTPQAGRPDPYAYVPFDKRQINKKKSHQPKKTLSKVVYASVCAYVPVFARMCSVCVCVLCVYYGW